MVVAMTVRRLNMNRAAWRKQVLIFTDSAVALGCVGKGRSSVPPLLRQCRIIAAVAMALQIIPKCRWVESERNVSDGPSRGGGVGVPPETAIDAAWEHGPRMAVCPRDAASARRGRRPARLGSVREEEARRPPPRRTVRCSRLVLF